MIKKISLAIAAFCFVGLSYAQDTKVLTLSEAISYALQNKVEATKANLDIAKGDAQIAQVKASAFPRVDVVSSTTFNPILQEMMFTMEGNTIKARMGQKWQSSNVVQVSQVLFNQSVFTGLKAAKSTKEFYVLNKELTDEQIVDKVANTYYQVYKADQMLENLDDNLNISSETVKIIKGLYDAGLAKKIDYDRSVVGINNIKASKNQLVNQKEIAENTLKFIIGMPMDQNIELPENTFDASVLPSDVTNYNGERTELRVMNKQLELLEWQKKASESEYYPTVALTGQYGWVGMGKKMPWFNTQYPDAFWSDMAAVGLNINIPIFNGFATKSKIQLNQIEIDKAKADLKDTQLALDMAHKNAVSSLNNSLIAIETQEENLKLAEEVLSNTRSNYQYGLATLNDLLDSERDLSDAKNNLTSSKLDYKLAEIEYLKSQGKLKTLNGNIQ